MNSSADLRENMRFARQQIEQGSREDLDLIAFPETFLYVGNDHQEKHRVAQTLEGDVVQTFREYARNFAVDLLLGSIYEKIAADDRHLYNTSVLINRQGGIDAVYRKIYMCDAPALGYNESQGIRPGDRPVVVDHRVGKIGFSICYDLRFPELYQALTTKGAEIIFVPAAFFLHTGKHHWLPLLTARAIETRSISSLRTSGVNIILGAPPLATASLSIPGEQLCAARRSAPVWFHAISIWTICVKCGRTCRC